MKKNIHKNNDLISLINFKLATTHKIFNNIIHTIQTELNSRIERELLEDGIKPSIEERNKKIQEISKLPVLNIELKQTDMRGWANLEKESHYVDMIEDSVDELTSPIVLKNFVNEKGEIVKKLDTRFILKSTNKTSLEDGKTKIFELLFDMEIYRMILMTNLGNFTKIDINQQRNFRSSNTFRVHELVKTVQNTKRKSIGLTLEEWNELLGSDYKSLSRVRMMLKTNVKIINSQTDLTIGYKDVKKEKKIQVFIKEVKTIDVLDNDTYFHEQDFITFWDTYIPKHCKNIVLTTIDGNEIIFDSKTKKVSIKSQSNLSDNIIIKDSMVNAVKNRIFDTRKSSKWFNSTDFNYLLTQDKNTSHFEDIEDEKHFSSEEV